MTPYNVRRVALALGGGVTLGSCLAQPPSPGVGAMPTPSRLEPSPSSAGASEAPSNGDGGVRTASAADSRPEHRLAIDLDPTRFVVREREATHVIVFDKERERLLEFHMLEAVPCDRSSVPKIGRITATTPAGSKPHGLFSLEWFTQRSSVDHTPFTASGFYLCSRKKFVVIRYVGDETTMSDARATLEELLSRRKIVLE